MAAESGDMWTLNEQLRKPSCRVDAVAQAGGAAALAFAARAGQLPAVKALVQRHAQIDHTSESGRTALHRACYGGHTEIVDFLLKSRANIDKQ